MVLTKAAASSAEMENPGFVDASIAIQPGDTVVLLRNEPIKA
jgi:hypothetical protein